MICDRYPLLVIYNSYILPNGVVEDAHFLRHLFSATLLEALGLKDDSGVIYELINYRYFMDHMLGDWDLMIDGMINVSTVSYTHLTLPTILLV